MTIKAESEWQVDCHSHSMARAKSVLPGGIIQLNEILVTAIGYDGGDVVAMVVLFDNRWQR